MNSLANRLVLALLCLSLALFAQDGRDDDEEAPTTAEIAASIDASGHLTIHVGSYDLERRENARIFALVPKQLSCQWLEVSRTMSTLTGLCGDWLKRGADYDTGKLELARLTRLLHEHGVAVVHCEVDLGHQGSSAISDEWHQTRYKKGLVSGATFDSKSAAELPGAIGISVLDPPRPERLFIPASVMLALPVLCALFIRRRTMTAAGGHRINWMVWMTWIDLGAWLYWISSARMGDMAELSMGLSVNSYPLQLLVGLGIFAGVPLAGISAGLFALGPVIAQSPGRMWRVIRVRLAAESQVLVPLGIFLISGALRSVNFGAPMYGALAAYVTFRALAGINWRLNYAETRSVTSGGLFDRTSALAARAGVKLNGLRMLRNRDPEDTNAFAASDGTVTLTESLVLGLTEREVDAVIAHELGHHRAGHLRFDWRNVMFWLYILGFGPLLAYLTTTFHLPAWFMAVPFGPLIYTVAQGMISQRHEYSADKIAAELTGDAEGAIAALARLAQMTRSPVRANGILGSVLSHPSMEQRVLAMARAHGVADARALAILDNPDEAYTGVTATLARAIQAEQPEPVQPDEVFTARRRVSYGEQMHWISFLAPITGLAIFLALIPQVLFYSRGFLLALPVAIVFAFLFTIGMERLCGHRWSNALRLALLDRLRPAPGAVFVGLFPDAGLRAVEGFHDWDFGFLTFEGDWLCYRGEKASFAIHRTGVGALTVVQGPRRWLRETRLQVEHAGGAFTINNNFANPSKAKAGRLRARITGWASVECVTGASLPPEPPPRLPELKSQSVGRLAALWHLFKAIVKTLIASTVITVMGRGFGPLIVISLLAIVLAVVLHVPEVLWPFQPPRDRAAEREPVPVEAPPVSV